MSSPAMAELAAPPGPSVRPLTLETRVAAVARLLLRDPHLTSRKIQAATAAAFGLAPSVLTGPSAAAEHVRPRYIAMALCRHFMSRGRATRLGPGTITAVARAFGKDRTCVREAEARYGQLVRDAIAEAESEGS